MFKEDSFEEELYSSMKKNLTSNSKTEDLKVRASNLKVIQSLNFVAEILEKNKFTKQAEAITSFMGKRIGLKNVLSSFQDKEFIERLDKDTSDIISFHFKNAGIDSSKFINKKYFNKYEQLLDVKYSRASKPSMTSEKPPVLYKGEIYKDNKYLENIKNIIANSTKNQEIDGADNISVTSEDFEDE